MPADDALLQLHLEPAEPIEIGELTAALNSLGRQYQNFAVANELAGKPTEARLLVNTVSPGSIDISFLPDYDQILLAAGLLTPLIDKAELIAKFARSIKSLLDFFKKDKPDPTDRENITAKDCDDAINILKPIANHGGMQTFNTINGGITMNVFQIDAPDAAEIIERAVQTKSLLQNPDAEVRQRVPLVWKRLDRDAGKTDGRTSPDKGVIEEIDPRAHAILFTDEMLPIKRQMIDDEENPYQNVYFVDVEVSRVNGKVVSYRVTGYHGYEVLEQAED
ncbi:hypothetical protein [Bradyrhizobium sp. USDA 313]|uniref:hypothetical protein n=1 Tax=Bradyrhizobium sp. USDA 313 TaxID=3156307 RepID=UPI003513AF43